MPIAGIGQGLGLGGGTSATASGSSGGGGVTQFNLGAGETVSEIEDRTGDPAGFITWDTDTFDVYVSDGNDNWAVTINRPNF